MSPDLPRQREQSERRFQIDQVGRQILGQGDPLGLLLGRFLDAALDIEAIGAALQRDRQATRRVVPERAGLRSLVAAIGERAGEAAVGIVGAADEGAVTPELEAEPAVLARGAAAILLAIVGREQVAAEGLVEGVQDLLDPESLGLLHRAGEVAPKIAQHRPPVDFAGGDGIELAFERGREVVLDIAAEEALQEHRDDAPAVLRHEAALLQRT